MHDGSSPAGRERPSSMQGMDMASLPPRKRPWQDGPGTGDHREMDPSCSDGGERKELTSVPRTGHKGPSKTHTRGRGESVCVCVIIVVNPFLTKVQEPFVEVPV